MNIMTLLRKIDETPDVEVTLTSAEIAPRTMLEASIARADRDGNYLVVARATKEAQHRQLAEDLRVIAILEEGNDLVRTKLAQLGNEDRRLQAAE